MKALITGASSGIGRDMARGLARRGYDLILVARRTERLEELGRTLPVQVQTISLDLAQKGNCRALYEQVKDQDLDILINNAGRGSSAPLMRPTWRRSWRCWISTSGVPTSSPSCFCPTSSAGTRATS